MRRLGLSLISLLVLPSPALAQIDNSALQCGSDATYFPRGDHWAMIPTGSYEYRVQRDGAPTVTNGTDRSEVLEAFNRWQGTTCPGGGTPNVALAAGADWVTRDRGDQYICADNGGPCSSCASDTNCYLNSAASVNVVYWITSNWAATRADDLTVALTTNQYIEDTGMIANADMEFNAEIFSWRTDSGGCSGTNCFHIGTVALHETGHFLGFNHVQCTDAVMYPQGSASLVNDSLSNHEATGVCTIYAPRDNSVTGRDRMEQCTNVSECNGSDICIKPVGSSAASPWGWCAQPCSTTANCDDGFICGQQLGGTLKFCKPGVNNTGGAAGGVIDPATGESYDLCAPCTAGDQCASGVCVSEGGADGICSRTCTGGIDEMGAATCPSGMMCLPVDGGASVCWPESPTSCGSPEFRGALNDTCFLQNDPGNENDDWFRPCGPELICFGFKPRCEGQLGSCVQYCNETDQPCQDGNMECCFGVDEGGACLGPGPDRQHGGCFDIRRPGESCVTAEQSICDAGSGCFHFGDPVFSKCYRNCPTGACATGEACIEGADACNNSFTLCCDNDGLPDECLPGDEVQFYDVGVACRQNIQCDSDMCLRFDGQSACSRWCNPVTGVGCPGDVDVNGDGVGDGGFRCLLIAGEGRCWPRNGPIEPPPSAVVDEPPGGCCNATSVSAGDLFLSALLFTPVIAVRLRRRRKR